MNNVSKNFCANFQDILRYTMTGNPQSEVQMYFGIDPDDGVIYLRELLTNPSPPRQQYQVI
jgi:hypothetical protein